MVYFVPLWVLSGWSRCHTHFKINWVQLGTIDFYNKYFNHQNCMCVLHGWLLWERLCKKSKAVREGSIVTKISDIQPTHHTTPILMVINITSSHVDYINLCMMSKLVSTFSIHHAQYRIRTFWQRITFGHVRSVSCNYDGHIVSFLFTICN